MQHENLELTETGIQYHISDATKRHKEHFHHCPTEHWWFAVLLQTSGLLCWQEWPELLLHLTNDSFIPESTSRRLHQTGLSSWQAGPAHLLWHAHLLPHSFQQGCSTTASWQLCTLDQPPKGSDKHESAHETTALRIPWHQWKQAKSTLFPEKCPLLPESAHWMASRLSQQTVHSLSKLLGKSNLHYCEQKNSLLEKRLPVSLLK